MWLKIDGLREEILVGDGIERNKKLWCFCSNLNDMYCIDMQNKVVEKRIIFEKLSKYKSHLFSKILDVNNVLYLIPYSNRKMIKYHIDNEKIEYIDFDNLYADKNLKEMFVTGCCFEEYIFLFPYFRKEIVRFNTKNNQREFLSLYGNLEHERNKLTFIRRCIVKGDTIWIAEDNGNRILKINAIKFESDWVILANNIHIKDLCIYGEKIYCLDTSGKIIVYDINQNTWEQILDVESNEFGFIEKTKNFIWLLPSGTNQIIKYSKGKIEKIDYPVNFIFSATITKSQMRTFSNIYSDEFRIIIMPRCNNTLVIIDKNTEEVFFEEIYFSEEIKNRLREDLYEKFEKGYALDEKEADFKWFIDLLMKKEKIDMNNINNQEKHTIYSRIMK